MGGGSAAGAVTGHHEGDIPGRTGHIFFVSLDLTGSHTPVKLLQEVSLHPIPKKGEIKKKNMPLNFSEAVLLSLFLSGWYFNAPFLQSWLSVWV